MVGDTAHIKKILTPETITSTMGRNRHQHSERSSWIGITGQMGKNHRLVVALTIMELEYSEAMHWERM